MNGKMTIYVHVNKPNATLTLTSTKGEAKVKTHILVFETIVKQKQHGFYLLSGYGFGGNKRWTPSATKNVIDFVGITPQYRSETITLNFPRVGVYALNVEPMSYNMINLYWKMDKIQSWVTYPRWNVTKMTNCTVTVW